MAVEVSAAAIDAARDRIPSVFRDTPQYISEPLSKELGVPVVVKVETVNSIGCFKGRGTWLAVAELLSRGAVGEGRGLVVASAGTMACELTDAVAAGDLPGLGAVYVPVGNAALVNGIGAWMRHAALQTKVIGVQAAAYAAALQQRSLAPIALILQGGNVATG